MSAYTGYLIRTTRLEKNLSQEGLAKGICATSYLSKIEQGLVEPGQEIIDRLFAALEIHFVRDPELEAEAQRQLEQYLFLIEGGEPAPEQEAFFAEHGELLAHSEFALAYLVFRLISTARLDSMDESCALLEQIEPYAHCLSARLRQWVLIIKAEYQQHWEDEWTALEQAAQLGRSSLVLYKRAVCAYHRGKYSLSVELAEQAYSQAAYEGNASVMIQSGFLLGSCACNRYDMDLAKRYFDRTAALTRGYRIEMDSYINYNLGSTYLELGDDQNALHYLKMTQEKEEDMVHNTLLHQKLAIVLCRTGNTEAGKAQLQLAKACFDGSKWERRKGIFLMEQMLRFAELMYEEPTTETGEFERVTRTLYDEAGEHFGFGFRRFYGRYLIEIYKKQRRYKEALIVQEEMDTVYIPE